ncbi:hypothetical protein [Alicyclobacillus fodiniaquatilis]|jgi:hypothetical protein|uniref:DUF4025 domain-containing protein n=1 Tax=Alicyclobacillus fodiniaquatilis TaxID=1661150 RepID=A0ABW4JFS0_9BACL
MEKRSLSHNEGVNETHDKELTGSEITREQIRDVYFAGTSDGVVFLENGQRRNLKDETQQD